jgi:hypothetical protein
VQIDPNTQAPDVTPSEDLQAPAPSKGRRNKQGRKPARQNGIADLADVEVTEQVAGASPAVIEGTDLDAVRGRLRSGAYNTREVAEVIARRLLASGDL